MVTSSNSSLERSYDIIATATDAAGNVSTSSQPITLVVDTTPPPAPIITTNAGIYYTARPTIEGTAEAGSLVEVFEGTNSLGVTAPDASGNWILVSDEALSQGSYEITAIASDAAGNTSVSSPSLQITLEVSDTLPEIIPDVEAPILTDIAIEQTVYEPGDKNLLIMTGRIMFQI